MTATAPPPGDLAIVGLGARIATGTDALTTAMSVRARKSFVRETRFVDRAGEPIALATCASVADDVIGRDRFVALAAPALSEAVRSWANVRFTSRGHATPPLPLLLGAPAEAHPSDPRGTELIAALGERSGVTLDRARSRLVAQGRAAGVYAIAQAAERIASGADEAILVGGVDSYFDPDRLEALDAARRLHGPATENGFIPGEGAGFLLLVSRRRASTDVRHGNIVGFGTEQEPRPFGAAEPCHALGLTLAMKRAIAPVGGARIGWALSDVVGERHRVDEWLFGSGRIQESLTPDLRHDTPLLLTGDLGAATVPVLTVLACMGWATASAPAELALVAAASDAAERGALLLGADTAGGRP